jgi:phosphopantetheine--protein transferase-like protein
MQAAVVVAHALEVLSIDEVDAAAPEVFTSGERAYAESKSDPQRRLAARLAAKRAAARALGGGVPLAEVEVRAGYGGPPTLRLTGQAAARLRQLGGDFARVSLTHGESHAAASVLVLRAE